MSHLIPSIDEEPKIIRVFMEAEQLLKDHGLRDLGWIFEFSNEKRHVGRCFHDQKRIVFSKHFVDNTPMEKIRDTILHEIAHALVGSGHGHDDVWKLKAIEVGAEPNRCAGPSARRNDSVKPNYMIVCPKCNQKWFRFRLRKSLHRATHCGVKVQIFKVKA